jgi:glycosyltransferase involved in cell wall biosynthesis
MKIIFPTIIAASGSDVYYNLLCMGLKKRGVDATVLPLGYQYEFTPLLYRSLRRTLAQYDIVHANGEYGHLFKLPGTPLVITLHHNVLDPVYQQYTTLSQKIYHYGLLRQRFKKSLRAADAVICISNATRSSFQNLLVGYDSKVTTIYNGINLEVFRPTKAAAPAPGCRLLFVGNITPRKGADVLASVMKKLGTGFELLCVTMQDPHMEFPTNVTVAARVPLARLPDIYANSTMLFFPSRLEGFGYAVAEAMACAKPVVCSNRSSLPELIDEGLGGFLCDIDDTDGFAEKIRFIYETKGLAETTGAYNLEKARSKFDLERMVDAYLRLYEKILAKSTATPIAGGLISS